MNTRVAGIKCNKWSLLNLKSELKEDCMYITTDGTTTQKAGYDNS
jgi:hypothetical protein